MNTDNPSGSEYSPEEWARIQAMKNLPTQEIHLELIRRAAHNGEWGEDASKDLRQNRHLWRAAVCCTGAIPQALGITTDGKTKGASFHAFMPLLSLRDMSQDDFDYHADEIYIVANDNCQEQLYELAETWGPDEIAWIPAPAAFSLWGGAMSFTVKGPKSEIHPCFEQAWEGDYPLSNLLRCWWD